MGAASCLYRETSVFREKYGYPPVVTWGPQASMYGGMLGMLSAAAALVKREETGVGTVTEIPMVDATMMILTFKIWMHSIGFDSLDTPNPVPDELKHLMYSAEDDKERVLKKLSEATWDAAGAIATSRSHHCADGRQILHWTNSVEKFNTRLLKALGIYHQLVQEGFVDYGCWEFGRDNNISDQTGLAKARKQRLAEPKQIPRKGPLPPILPIVLYNGNKRWDASLDIRSMLQPGPRGLEPYQPQMRYLLIDEGVYSDSELKPLRNLVAALFRMENSRSGREIDEVLGALVDWLSAPEQTSLRRAFASWIGRVIMRKLPGGAVEGVHDLLEMRTMLSERMDEWAEEWMEEGQRKGETDLLLRQMTKRFGTVPQWAISRLQQAELQQLEAWGERLLEVNTLEELFE